MENRKDQLKVGDLVSSKVKVQNDYIFGTIQKIEDGKCTVYVDKDHVYILAENSLVKVEYQ